MGLQDSGLTLTVVEREPVGGECLGATPVTPRAGEIIGELVLAMKLRTPVMTLADVIHPFPASNRVLGQSLQELAGKVSLQSAVRL